MKFEKLKKKISDNRETLVTVGIFSTITAIYVTIIVVAVKQEKALQKTLINAASRGDMILPNTDGSYWIIPKAV